MRGSPKPKPKPKSRPKTNFYDLPLCASPLSHDEAIRAETAMAPLSQYLGSPGDWGYETKLGKLTELLYKLRDELREAAVDAAVRERMER